VLVRVDTAHVEGNSFIESLIPDEPHIRLGEVSNGRVLDLADSFTRIQVYDTDASLEFSDGKVFTEDGTNQPFWFPGYSEYLLNIDETIEVNTFEMTLSPSGDSVELIIYEWDTTGICYKKWGELSPTPTIITSHSVGDFLPFSLVRVKVDGNPYGDYMSDPSGWITFDYTDGFPSDTLIFEAYVIVGIEEEITRKPKTFVLYPAYPNPFNFITGIRYNLAKDVSVELAIYNTLGAKIRTLVKDKQRPAYHRIYWDGTDDSGKRVASGVYFYRLKAGNFSQTRKLLLLICCQDRF
jgi:hypothetical protein